METEVVTNRHLIQKACFPLFLILYLSSLLLYKFLSIGIVGTARRLLEAKIYTKLEENLRIT